MKLPTSIGLELDVRDALDRIAAIEERSRSWVVEKMLRAGIAARDAQSLRPAQAEPGRRPPE